jgi:hypothetical protein
LHCQGLCVVMRLIVTTKALFQPYLTHNSEKLDLEGLGDIILRSPLEISRMEILWKYGISKLDNLCTAEPCCSDEFGMSEQFHRNREHCSLIWISIRKGSYLKNKNSRRNPNRCSNVDLVNYIILVDANPITRFSQGIKTNSLLPSCVEVVADLAAALAALEACKTGATGVGSH